MRNDDVEQGRLKALLRDLAAQDERSEPSPRVRQAVMHRWAQRTAMNGVFEAKPSVSQERRTRWSSVRVALGAAGIAAAVLVATWVMQSLPSSTTQPTSPAGVANPAPRDEPTVATAPAGVQPEPALSASEPPAAAGVRSVTPGIPPVARQAEPFVPLLPMTDEELGTIRLARVRLRGPAASALGLDARMPVPGADGFIEADVLLGEDGLARAIRFAR